MTIDLSCATRWITLGFERENLARQQEFDFSAWAEEYGSGVPQLLFQRPGETTPYPVLLTVEGTTATWTPTATDTAIAGEGKAQLSYVVDEVVAKNAIFAVLISPSLGASGDPPEGFETWLEELTELAADAQEAAIAAGDSETDAEAAATAAGNAQTAAEAAQGKAEAAQAAIENMSASAYITNNATGTPAVDVVKSTDPGDGHVNLSFRFRYLKGAKGDTGQTGQTGQPGRDGQDGAAATVAVGSVTTLPAGSNATVVNSGTSSAAVLDFGIPKGDTGDAGVTSVNSKTGAVVLDAGDLEYDDTETYPADTVGSEISSVKSAIQQKQDAWTSLDTVTVTASTTSVYVDVPDTATEIEVDFTVSRTNTTSDYLWICPGTTANNNTFNRLGPLTNACVWGACHIWIGDSVVSSICMHGSGRNFNNYAGYSTQGWMNAEGYGSFKVQKKVGLSLSTGIETGSTLTVRYR